jgi:hypothetical protein
MKNPIPWLESQVFSRRWRLLLRLTVALGFIFLLAFTIQTAYADGEAQPSDEASQTTESASTNDESDM